MDYFKTSFTKRAVNPETLMIEEAEWGLTHYGKDVCGIRFKTSGRIFRLEDLAYAEEEMESVDGIEVRRKQLFGNNEDCIKCAGSGVEMTDFNDPADEHGHGQKEVPCRICKIKNT